MKFIHQIKSVKSVVNYFITACSVAVLFFACKNEQHDKEIAQIGTIRNKLEMTDLLLKNVDHEMADRLGTEVKNNSQFIQFNINKIGDTIDFKTALFLSHYKTLQDQLEGIAENGEKLETAIDSTKKTLDNLEHDIVNNSLAKGITAATALEQEEENVNEMYEYTSSMAGTLQKAKTGYDTLTPRVNEYMKTLNQKLAEKISSVPKK